MSGCFVSPRRADRRGMTLIELLVGLTITGLVLAAGYAALFSIADHRQRAAAAADDTARTAAMRRALGEWLAGARLSADGTGPEFRGTDGIDAGRSDDELAFGTSAAAGVDGRPAAVRLFVDRDPGTAERGVVAEVGDPRLGTRERLELAPAATGLDVRYLSALSRDPVWLPSWISETVLPRAVELRIEAPDDSLPDLLRLPVLVAIGDAR